VGSHTLTATFTPADSNNYTSATASTTLTVNQATLTVTATNASRVYGTPNPSFTGSVSGAQNGDTFTASYATTAGLSSSAGTYVITPSVTGPNLASYAVSLVNGTLTVTPVTSLITLTPSSTSLNPNATLTLTAQVASTTTGAPTGSVSFYDGATLLGTTALSGNTASYSTGALSAGVSHNLTATYSGDVNFTPSSTGTSVTVLVAPLEFTASTPTVQSQTVIPGHAASYTFNIAPLYSSFPATVNFSVTGLPPGATASFSPATIAANSGATNVTLTIQTAAATASNQRSGSPYALAVLLLPLAGMSRIRRFSGRWQRLVCLLLIAFASCAGTLMLSGCGSSPNGFLAQGPKDYTVTVTASSGSLQRSFTILLNVQ